MEATMNNGTKQFTTPLQAIRQMCAECMGGSAREVALCTSPDCPLYGYRDGHNPRRKGIGGRLQKPNLS